MDAPAELGDANFMEFRATRSMSDTVFEDTQSVLYSHCLSGNKCKFIMHTHTHTRTHRPRLLFMNPFYL